MALAAPVIAAIGVAWLTTRSSRLIAREQRLVDRRADAYALLAEYTVRLRQFATIANPDLDDDDPLMPPPLSEEERYRMFAHVEIYGSDRAREVYNDLLTGSLKVRTWVADLEHARGMSSPYSEDEVKYRTEALQNARDAKKELLETCQRALDMLNTEMRRGSP